jgi:transcriptional regulator with XRE-family HTH domain
VSELSALIRQKRQSEGLSLRKAGEASGVAFSTLGRIESGAEPSPKVDRAIRRWLSGETPTSLFPAPPMTLRDWFAGQALVGLLANKNTELETVLDAADWAYATADALLTARKAGDQ